MRNKVIAFFLVAITSVVLFPAESNAKTSDSNRTVNERATELQYQRRGSYRQRRTERRYNRRYDRRNDRRRYYPRRYRNYGQYRRTQNRNYGQYRNRQVRRSRLVRQYYYRNGRRYVRNVRVYY